MNPETTDQPQPEVITRPQTTPENSRRSTTQGHVVVSAHSGPLPTPEDFAAYENVQQGAADRIIRMAEDALRAEIRMGYTAAGTQFVSMFLGKFFIYFLAAASVYLVIAGKEVAALLAGLAPITQAVVNGVDFRKDNSKQKSKKQRK